MSIGINKEDMYKVTADKEIGESNVLLVNGKNYLCGIFTLEKDSETFNSYYLCGESENIRYLGLKNKNYSLIFFNKEVG